MIGIALSSTKREVHYIKGHHQSPLSRRRHAANGGHMNPIDASGEDTTDPGTLIFTERPVLRRGFLLYLLPTSPLFALLLTLTLFPRKVWLSVCSFFFRLPSHFWGGLFPLTSD